MADTRLQERSRRLGGLLAGRLAQNRWTLAAGIAAVLAARYTADASVLFASAAIALLVAVAALAPRRMRGQRQADRVAGAERGAVDGLSAQNLAAAVNDPLIVFDAAGGIVHANDAARTAFGAVEPAMSLLMKFRAPEIQALVERVRTGTVASEAVDYIERVPIERVYRVTASAVGHGSGLFVVVFKDQSEARRVDRMRADFIANASHEMRTPLASIAGFIETLRGPARDDPAARDQFLLIMQSQTARMARLIDDLLALSRLEMKPYLPPDSTVDVRQILDSVIETLGPLAEVEVLIEREFGAVSVQVRGDPDELFQVFENLLENACKYGQPGGRVTVGIEETADHSEVAVTVRDFGPGIPEEHIPRLTERFYRVDVDTSRAQKGTGLGLSIVKHILTRHNARLTIKSQLGEGAAFTVHFPSA